MSAFDLACGIILFLLVIFGVCGNSLSLLVWIKGRRCKKLPGSAYLRALAVSDNLALCIPVINDAINLVLSFSPRDESPLFCRVHVIGVHYGLMVSTWIIVSFTIERTIVIFRAEARNNLMSTKRTAFLMLTIFLVNFVLNVPYGVVFGVSTEPIYQRTPFTDGSTGNISFNTTKPFETGTVLGNGSDINTTGSVVLMSEPVPKTFETGTVERNDYDISTTKPFETGTVEWSDYDISTTKPFETGTVEWSDYDISTTEPFDTGTVGTNPVDITRSEPFEGAILVGYRKMCVADPDSFFSFYNWYHIWFMDAFLIFIIPFSLMTGSNVLVLYHIISQKNAAWLHNDKKIKAVTLRAVIVSVAHCVTSGAFCVSVLIPGLLEKAFAVKYSREYYISEIFLVLAYLNHSINFLLYSMFGTEFRRDCVELLWKKPTTVGPMNSTSQAVGTKGSSTSKFGDTASKPGASSSTAMTKTTFLAE